MRWSKMGRSPAGGSSQILAACLIVVGLLLLAQVLPSWVGTLLLGVAMVAAGVLILKH